MYKEIIYITAELKLFPQSFPKHSRNSTKLVKTRRNFVPTWATKGQNKVSQTKSFQNAPGNT